VTPRLSTTRDCSPAATGTTCPRSPGSSSPVAGELQQRSNHAVTILNVRSSCLAKRNGNGIISRTRASPTSRGSHVTDRDIGTSIRACVFISIIYHWNVIGSFFV